MKANFIKSMALAAVVFTGSMSLHAQKETSNFSIGADLVSRYIWRGLDLGGSSPHIQPSIEYAFGESGLAIGAWGSQSLGGITTGAEADLYLTYSFADMFTVGLTDYFFPSDHAFSYDRYFNYKKETTGHTFEVMAGFDGTESFPISIMFAMNVYGADGTDENGDPYYAKYLELGYSKTVGETDISVFVGAALDDPKEELGASGWYGNSAGIINLGTTVSKSLKISDSFSLPVSTSLIFNPEAENIYIVFAISL
jgi:hypothetical protein